MGMVVLCPSCSARPSEAHAADCKLAPGARPVELMDPRARPSTDADWIALGGVAVFLLFCAAIAWLGWALYHPGGACR